MAVFRVEKNKGYTVMSNHHLRNKELSLKAKGLLSQMLSLPEDWDYTLAGLSLINRESIDAIRTAVWELEKAGYITRRQGRDEKGKMTAIEYTIYEQPQPPALDCPVLENPTADKPILENPTADNPTSENPTQLNKELLKTNLPKKEKLNTDISNTHSIPFHSLNPSPLEDAAQPPERKRKEATDAYSVYEEIIKDNIEYDYLIQDRYLDRDRIEEILALILETVCTKRKTIRIAGDDYPAELVKARFMKLNSEHIRFVLDCMETMKSGQQTLSKTGCYGIDFDNVTFNYTQGGKDALSDVDIHLEPGSLNAFVGPSGAGKTTAVQLLGRYWDVSSGTIKIGGVPVTELQTENLSDLTAFVFQDVFLLEDTLLENIRMGTDATEEQVRQAAKAAQIDDFIMSLPKGYATRIGDEGVKLSGGQQQRISIARAILKDAPIVVFDEATSYSDIENEHKIQLALQNLLRGKTTIMIAHRLHTIRNADKIFVFQDGKVVEQGTHDELIASGSTYSHMWDTYTRETIGEE